jgi:hypothetical protein
MVNDIEARDAVRQLMKRYDSINAQYLGMTYVLVQRDANEYARLLEATEKAIPTVIQIAAVGDEVHGQVYAALDDPNADWCKAVFSMLNQGPIILTRDQTDQIMRLMRRDEPPEPPRDWRRNQHSP